MMKVINPAPLSWIAEYLAGLCYYQGGEDGCPVDAELAIECPFAPDENGCTHCSEVEPEDWLRAIIIDARAKENKTDGC